MAKQQIEETFGNTLKFLKTIFPLTIGMFIGVLGGVGLSYMDDQTKVSTPPKPALNSKRSVLSADTSIHKNNTIDPSVKLLHPR